MRFSLLPALAWLRRSKTLPVLVVPFAAEWHQAEVAPNLPWQAACAYAGIILLIVALARPQSLETTRQTQQQGYDIVLAIDLSRSMLAEDYIRDGNRINRLQAVKPVLEAFINRAPDRSHRSRRFFGPGLHVRSPHLRPRLAATTNRTAANRSP